MVKIFTSLVNSDFRPWRTLTSEMRKLLYMTFMVPISTVTAPLDRLWILGDSDCPQNGYGFSVNCQLTIENYGLNGVWLFYACCEPSLLPIDGFYRDYVCAWLQVMQKPREPMPFFVDGWGQLD